MTPINVTAVSNTYITMKTGYFYPQISKNNRNLPGRCKDKKHIYKSIGKHLLCGYGFHSEKSPQTNRSNLPSITPLSVPPSVEHKRLFLKDKSVLEKKVHLPASINCKSINVFFFNVFHEQTFYKCVTLLFFLRRCEQVFPVIKG